MTQRKFTLDVTDWFWSVIDRIRNQPDSLLDILNSMTEQELVQFYQDYREATDELPSGNDEQKELTDSELHEVCAWVVAQGKNHYKRVWNNFLLLQDQTIFRLPITQEPPPKCASTSMAGNCSGSSGTSRLPSGQRQATTPVPLKNSIRSGTGKFPTRGFGRMNGNLASSSDPLNGTTNYGFDLADQQIAVQNPVLVYRHDDLRSSMVLDCLCMMIVQHDKAP